jgi:hypothetical protein
VPSLPLAPQLEPPNRAGPADSWAKFDHARETLGGALADNNRIADSNYGIGAKVSAAAVNPHGVVYLSWRDGVGHMVTLGRDPSGVRGMRQHRLTDGTITATMPLDDDAMPAEIRAAGGHGTMVVFLGHHEQEDTTLPPAGRGGERWLSKAINQRFYELPDWASVRVREIRVAGRDREIVFRQARGQRQFLDGSTIAHGTVELVGARALWRILDDRHHERAKEAGIWASTGHRAALLQGELFELATAGRAGGYQKVQEFGIRFGYERVVIYVQPDPAHGHVSQDSVRTTVKVDGEPLPWDRYAAEFEERMPEELRRFQEEIAAGSAVRDHRQAIRDRLKPIADLFRIPRYRASADGLARVDEASTGGEPQAKTEKPNRPGGPPGGDGGRNGDLYSLFERQDGRHADEVRSSDLPEIDVTWVSAADGTRTAPHLEDRAARYDRRHNVIEINADFRGYRDVIDRWDRRYRKVPGAITAIEDLIGAWWQQALEETVLGILAHKGSEYWDGRAVDAALSQEALTAAAMQRYHLDAIARRELGQILGASRLAA